MKQLLLTCGIIATMAGTAVAQVQYTDFITQKAPLVRYMLHGPVDSEKYVVSNMNSLMNKQITWLQADVKTKQTAYNASAKDSALLAKQTGYLTKLHMQKQVLDNENKNLSEQQNIYNNELPPLFAIISKASQTQKNQINDWLNNFANTLKTSVRNF